MKYLNSEQDIENIISIFDSLEALSEIRILIDELSELKDYRGMWLLIADRMHKLSEEDVERLIGYLYNASKDDPERLSILYKITNDANIKSLIFNHLLEIDSGEQVVDIILSDDVDTDSAIEKLRPFPNKLFEIYKHSPSLIKDKIVNIFLSDDREYQLRLLLKSSYKDKAGRYLIQKYKDSKEDLYMLFDTVSDEMQEFIIRRLVVLNAEEEIETLLSSKHRNNILNKLILIHKTNSKELLNLYKDENLNQNQKSKIEKFLIDLGEKKLILSELEPFDAFLKLLSLEKPDIKGFYVKYSPIIEFAFSDRSTATYFFSRLDNKTRLYLLLASFGIGRYIDIVLPECSLKVIQDYYSHTTDCVSEKIEYANIFEYVWKDGIADNDKSLQILSLLLDKTKFIDKIGEISSNYKLVDDIETEKKRIDNEYTIKLMGVSTENEIEEMLLKKKEEKSKLVNAELIDSLQKIANYNTKLPKIKKDNLVKNFREKAVGNIIDILELPSNVRPIYNVYSTKTLLEKEMEEKMSGIDDSRRIFEIKKKYKEQLSTIVDKGDYLFSLQKTFEKKETPEFIQKASEVLIENTDFAILDTIIHMAAMSENELWLPAVYKILDYQKLDSSEIAVKALFNKFSLENLKYILKYFTDLKTGSVKKLFNFSGHMGEITALKFNPTGTQVVSGSRDKTLRIWDLKTGQCIYNFKDHNTSVTSIGFSIDGKIILSGGADGKISVRNLESNTFKIIDSGFEGSLKEISFTPDQNYIIADSGADRIRIFDAFTGREFRTLTGEPSAETSDAFSPDGKLLIATGKDNSISVYNVKSAELITKLHGHSRLVTQIVFSPENTMLATGSRDKTINIWDFGFTYKPKLYLLDHLLYLFFNADINQIKIFYNIMQEMRKLPEDIMPQVKKIVETTLKRIRSIKIEG